tara:strand:+ start:266 stop:826 length:561 start_codon:yes stop_codon:yes gene_type:complete
MTFESIECCYTTVFSFLELDELCHINKYIWNHCIHESLTYNIQLHRIDNMLYTEILSNIFTQKDMLQCSILFYIEHYLKNKNNHNFKKFLFDIFDTYMENKPKTSYFYLATRQHRLFFAYKVNNNIIIVFVQIGISAIFYTIFTRNIDTIAIPQTEYLVDNKIKMKDNAYIRSLFFPNIYSNEQYS